jgi:hypothetical protein
LSHVRARVERARVHEAGRGIVQSHRRAEALNGWVCSASIDQYPEGERWALDRKRPILEPLPGPASREARRAG